MNFNEDTVALFLIGFLTVVFIGAAIQQGEVLSLANGVMEFGLGAIAGYMARSQNSLPPEFKQRLQELQDENHQLRERLQHRQHLRSQMQNLSEDETL
jgi:cell shape-determining protein MreC